MAQEVEIGKSKRNARQCNILPGALNEYLFANQDPPKPTVVVQKVKEQTIEILCKCVKPNYKEKEERVSDTGLVFGYVQSGKTLSFTSVISMAADNKYRLVIVLAGRSVILLDQTFKRLKDDLGQADNRDEYLFERNPNIAFKDRLIGALEGGDRTVVITILKHQLYLNELSKLFAEKKVAKLIANMGALIIDDESDQASLSTFAYENSKKEEGEIDKFSAIYSGIKHLRSKLNYHSYIQYTATPQANLLVDYLDILSPKWHVVLEPGSAYTGGYLFFKEEITKTQPAFKYAINLAKRDNYAVVFSDPKKDKNPYFLNLIRRIPEKEKYHPTKLDLAKCPESLEECLKSFLIQSIILTKLKKEIGHASMVIHLHVLKSAHSKVEGWLNLMVRRWLKDIDLDSVKKDFLSTFLDDEKVNKSGFTFNDVYSNLKKYLGDLLIHHISGNAKVKDYEIDWDASRAHILIGGMKLDRGFTVEYLTHTYMPRHTLGSDNADTIQQRCRFFGYKKGYIKSCRVYLPADLICKYSDYVEDEQDLRNFLIEHSDINDFFDPKQAMSLTPRLRPTRQNVLSNKLVKNYFNKYIYFNPLLPENFTENLRITDGFISKITQKKLLIDYNSEGRRHDLYKLDIDFFEKELLDKLKLDNFIDVLVRKKILRYLKVLKTDMKMKECWVMNMGQGRLRERQIVETLVEEERDKVVVLKIDNPFSGRDSAKPSKWPDEKEILNFDSCRYKLDYDYNNELIIQIHKIKAKYPKNSEIHGREFSTICIYFPPILSKNYIALNKKDV